MTALRDRLIRRAQRRLDWIKVREQARAEGRPAPGWRTDWDRRKTPRYPPS